MCQQNKTDISNLFRNENNQYVFKLDTLNRLPAYNIFQNLELLPSINYYGSSSNNTLTSRSSDYNTMVIRGIRQQNFLRINNIDISDPIDGGFGQSDQNRMPTPSIFAYDNIEFSPVNYSCSNFNNLGAVVNMNLRKGNTQKFEIYSAYTGTISCLYGSTNNDYKVDVTNKNSPMVVEASDSRKYQSSGDRSIDIGLGCPLLFINNASFFISYHNYFRQYNAGLEVYDPDNNNLGQLPNQRTFVNNFTGTLSFNILNDINLEINGMYGMSCWENASWEYLYATDRGLYNIATEREAHQIVNNYGISFLNARISNDKSNKLTYKLEIGITNHINEQGKKASYNNPGLSGFDITKPEDNYNNSSGIFELGSDLAIDRY